MAKVTTNNFSGGLDEDSRSHSTNTFNDVSGFDTLSHPYRLTPYGESEAEALTSGDITDKLVSDVLRDSNGYILAIGRVSAANPTQDHILTKDSGTNIASTYSTTTVITGLGGHLGNSALWYKTSFYYIDKNALGIVRVGAGVLGNVGYGSIWNNMLIPRPIIHPADDIAYFAVGQNLAKVNNTTYSSISSVILPTTQFISSLTDYDAYLAIGTAPTYEGGKSRVYLWNRDTSLSTFTSNIDWGEGSLMVLENIGGTLIGVSISDGNYFNATSYTVTKTKKITIRYLSGSQAVIFKEFDVDSTFSMKNYKARTADRLYFGGDNSTALYVVKKNKDGTLTFSKDRFINNGTAITTLRGISIIGDYLFTMFDTAGTSGNIYRTKVTSSYTNTSTWTTNINPNMPLEDRASQKKLMKVIVNTAPLPASGSITAYYSVDGSSFVEMFTQTTDNSLSTPATRDVNGSPLLDGREYQFKVTSTGGAEITGLDYEYEKIMY